MFLSFKAKFVSQFSPELGKLESSNMVNICVCIVRLRLRVMALIFLFFKSLQIWYTYSCRRSDCLLGLRLRVMTLICLFLSFFVFSLN